MIDFFPGGVFWLYGLFDAWVFGGRERLFYAFLGTGGAFLMGAVFERRRCEKEAAKVEERIRDAVRNGQAVWRHDEEEQ